MLTNTQKLTLHINQGNRSDSQAYMHFQKKSTTPTPPYRPVCIYMYIPQSNRGIFSFKKLHQKWLGICESVLPGIWETWVCKIKGLRFRNDSQDGVEVYV